MYVYVYMYTYVYMYIILTVLCWADHMWWSGGGTKHPNPLAPRCAPCGFHGNLSLAPVAIPRGCPCTPSLLCETTPELAGLQAHGHSCALPRSAPPNKISEFSLPSGTWG